MNILVVVHFDTIFFPRISTIHIVHILLGVSIIASHQTQKRLLDFHKQRRPLPSSRMTSRGLKTRATMLPSSGCSPSTSDQKAQPEKLRECMWVFFFLKL